MKGRFSSLAVMVLGVMVMAPTVGDAGACGRTASELDRDTYASGRKSLDCRRCGECGITNDRCTRACDPSALPDVELPATCQPLYFDGVVCLRALEAASCDAFATYVDDVGPAIPSECDFCKVPIPTVPTGTFVDGGAAEDGP